jgi:putative heme-binding domain-containing protein
VVNILDGQKKNNWFRPVDPRVAPDGSLFVTDWYDPGVGGHGQRDLTRGRIFRVAPPGTKYRVPKFDFSTPEGAVEALKNPASSVRYLAWTALHGMGPKAEPALLKLWQSDNPRYRARALWLLGKIDGKGQRYVDLALQDKDPDIRIVGIRLARQLGLDLIPVIRQVVDDPSPQVRCDAAIALRFCKSPEAAALWADLALRHEGKDRWYLEALGIGAHLHWDASFDAWLKAVENDWWKTRGGRDIVWRSRASKTPEYLAQLIDGPKVFDVDELPRYFRAFDFQKGDNKEKVLARLAFETKGQGPTQDLIVAESLARLKGFDLKKEPRYAAAVEALLDRHRGSPLFIDLVDRFSVAPRYPELLAIAQKNADAQLGVNAVRVLFDKGQQGLLEKGLHDKDVEVAVNTARALGTSGDGRAFAMLRPIALDPKQPIDLRRQAVRSLARAHNGAQEIVKLARAKQLPEELNAVAGAALQQTPWKEVQQQAAQLFPIPATKNNEALPPISELVKRRGDAGRGKVLFATTGTCANCHLVNGAGKEVGPDLSEIGKKLSPESLYESILYPSASISHNYETYVLTTKNDTILTGVLVSQTREQVSLKGPDAIVHTFKTAEIDMLQKSNVSLMPADLHKALTVQDLHDLVEYLLTLKEAQKPKK